ncbi:substrate-binding domain-containing protein [Streptomyces sp. ID01-12c]|uniref:substrate-binding domain-containing protein n=1 Tax=Streptomyces caniscabiei TaxID=2746961 RepID=UPI00177D235F|nr:substrate-binding domain-containing protein [Streptomyces caniscabiei]MBD9700591.1 substrate-binding domain-containing protein [Streptomyces caniscabiei]MDX3727749.1 substrate-binding domain-containing protein [Streptomyces caniscabiei]
MTQADVLRALDARAAGQWGLVTTAQAKLDGVQGVQLLRLERSGVLESVGHGVYRLAASPSPEHLRIKVAWLRLDPGTPARDRRTDGSGSGVVSHTSACAVHGLGGGPADPVELTVASRRTTRDETVVLHRAATAAEDITVVDGLPVTTVPRTVVDLLEARADAARTGAFVAEAAARGLVRVEDLAPRVAGFAGAYGLPAEASGAELLESLCARAGRPLRAGKAGRPVTRTSGPGAASDPERKRPTIWEVAKRAGVSHQTVSRFLKNDGGMKPATRERIERAVAELDYRPNLMARSMRTRRSHRITIVLPELSGFVPIPLLRGASAAAHEAGYMTDVVGLEGGESRRARSVLSLLEARQADGVLSLVPLGDLAGDGGFGRWPVVVLGEYDDKLQSRGRLADGRPAEEILRHLADQGHRRFLHVAGSQDWASARNRRAVYVEAIERLGLTSYGVVDGDWSVRSGYEAARDLPADSGVTAVLAANDYVALGVLRGFQDRGVRVPEEMSVFGWDDEEFTRYFSPSISTVHINKEEVGRQSMLSLLALLRGEPEPQSEVADLFRLVPRGSSGPVDR